MDMGPGGYVGAMAGTGHLYSHTINTKSSDGQRSRHCFIGLNAVSPPILLRWALLMNEALKLERLHAIGDRREVAQQGPEPGIGPAASTPTG